MGTAAILTGVTSLIGGVAAKQSADAQAKAAVYNAEIQQRQYEAQAKLNERKANDVTAQAEAQSAADAEKEREIRRKAEAMQAAQRAAYGASGIETNNGSALQVQIDAEEQGEKDAATFNLNSARRRFQAMNAAQTYRHEANLNRMAGENTVKMAQAQASATKKAGTNSSVGSIVKQDWYRMFPGKRA